MSPNLKKHKKSDNPYLPDTKRGWPKGSLQVRMGFRGSSTRSLLQSTPGNYEGGQK